MASNNTTLEAKPRTGTGKGPARQLRAKGLIPAVVYGKHLSPPAQIAVDPLAVKKAIATPHKLNTLITLKVEGQGDKSVLLKDYQQDPVTREILHADFIDVRDNEQVKVLVPLVLVGKAVGVAEGGILSQQRRELEVWALPKAIPEKIEADVTNLKVAQALHVNDIKLPAGITVKTTVNYTLAVVAIPEKEEVVVAAVPVAGAAVPGAAPGAEGAAAAPAAGGKPGEAAKPGEAKAAAPAGGGKKEDKKK
ncbi:MAG: 50S ribosomal protein L25 [Myxococcaceae bacterium]